MICGKCGEKIDTQYGYIRGNGVVYHNGVCPSSLPTASACNVSCVTIGEFPSGYYVMIPSTEHQQLKDTIADNQATIEQLQAQLEACRDALVQCDCSCRIGKSPTGLFLFHKLFMVHLKINVYFSENV